MSRDWLRLPALPGPDIPVIDPATGRMTRDWYRYWTVADSILRGVTALSLNDLANIDAAAPTNGQRLTWVAADSKWKGA
ncbi:hypothetical protein [Kaistia sp. MMO-174]|uniref:hypothetical protein n=1 Tax=Kaistia sp. MMO-174 TaxID=3081256 RepID=UPI00301681DC